MSYYAHGYGYVTVKNGLTADEILSLYPNGKNKDCIVINGMEYAVPNVSKLLNILADRMDGFDEVTIDETQSDDQKIVLELCHRHDKYHEEYIYSALDFLAPITLCGDIEFEGEDDCKWKFHFCDGQFAEYNGVTVYECDSRASLLGYNDLTETTELHAVRYDGLDIDQNVTVMVYHKPGLDVMEAINKCLTEWFKTPSGQLAWKQSGMDYNIGDWLCGPRPLDDFTAKYGFVLDPGDDHKVIEISYDRVLGDGGQID